MENVAYKIAQYKNIILNRITDGSYELKQENNNCLYDTDEEKIALACFFKFAVNSGFKGTVSQLLI